MPHHDGGHCSYLTPPALSGPAPRRRFTNHGYTTTDEHKIYQGLWLREAGAAMSLTSYFDLVRMLADAWTHRHGRRPALAELLSWYGANVGEAVARAGGVGYLPIGAQLGAEGPSRDVPIHSYEASHEIRRTDEERGGAGGGARPELAGLSMSELMGRYAVLAPAETGDLLVGHNLFAWHGGLEGGGGRGSSRSASRRLRRDRPTSGGSSGTGDASSPEASDRQPERD